MDPLTILAVYAIIWWLVLFMVLPFGVKPIEAEDVAKGQAHGAPQKPLLIKKLLITTAISCVLMGIFYAVAISGLVSFRPQS
ncbi:MAG: DUF1467 family protein [Magnetovibrionaceae bacterium]